MRSTDQWFQDSDPEAHSEFQEDPFVESPASESDSEEECDSDSSGEDCSPKRHKTGGRKSSNRSDRRRVPSLKDCHFVEPTGDIGFDFPRE